MKTPKPRTLCSSLPISMTMTPSQDCWTVAPTTQPSPPHNGNVMVVDDNPANLDLLEVILQKQGHEVLSFPRGRLALAEAARNPPDLILLDISMPEMNGYEVCERLKSTPYGAGIPVFFLSALTETQDKVKAFH